MTAPITPNNDMSFYIKKLENHIQRYSHSLYNRKEFEECSLMNMWVVDFLFNQGENDTFQKDVEAEFFINRATASKMLSLMEEKGLIRRTSAAGDARLKKLELLPKGLKLHEVCQAIRQETEKKVTKELTQEEVLLFKSLCRKILRSMEESYE